MKRQLAGTILRLVAVVMFVIGGAQATSSTVGLYGARAMQSKLRAQARTRGSGLPSEVQVRASGLELLSEADVYVILTQAQFAVWGLVLYLLSPLLAWFVCGPNKPLQPTASGGG